MLVHLMLELYGCDRHILSDELLVKHVLEEYPAHVEMEKVSPVHLYQIETSNPLDAGLSGFVVIAQSHISLHAWPEYGEVDIDICSCKELVRKMLLPSPKRSSRRTISRPISLSVQHVLSVSNSII